MKIYVWNVRGLNHPLKQKEVVSRIYKMKVEVVCLLETRVKEHKMQGIVDKWFPGWSYLQNYSHAKNARIWMLWRDGVQVSNIAINDQSITNCIQYNSHTFYFCAIYGCNESMDRKRLWEHLSYLHSIILDSPWLLVGDYNVTMDPSESSNSNGVQTCDMKDFMEISRQISIFDHSFTGPLYTWSNKQQVGFLARKLDRALINGGWLVKFPHFIVEFLPPEVSDHCPVIVSLQQEIANPPKPFKFFNYWAKHPDFMGLVQQSWLSQVNGNSMRQLYVKLKRLKVDLKIFNLSHFGWITKRVDDKRRELAAIQVSMLNTPSPDLVECEKIVSLELNDLLLAEESFFKQKARVDWIIEGDQNTKFFQKTVAANQNRTMVKSLINAAGIKLTTFSQISEEVVTFYKSLIGSVDVKVTGCPKQILEDVLQSFLNEEEASNLSRPIHCDEIKSAMFSIGSDKAPGPDGYSSGFFKAAWSIVGGDVEEAIMQFFQTGILHPAFNSTSITLVPKNQNPNSIKDYRPISCCTVIYKCITKILSNRLKQYMPKLIGKNQSAFITGRSIVDNVLLAQEL